MMLIKRSSSFRFCSGAVFFIGLLLFCSGSVLADDEYEKPYAFAFGVAPGGISVNWEHSGNGVAYFTVERESPYWLWNGVSAYQRNLPDFGLQADTIYRYVVCAFFIDGEKSCSDLIEARTLAPVPQPSEPTPTPTPTPTPIPDFYPELTARSHTGLEVYLSWTLPPSASIAITSVPLYRNGVAIYDALQAGDLDGDHVDFVRANSTHRYQICFEGPAIGERCSEEVTGGPVPIPPTAPADVQLGTWFRPGERVGGIRLRPRFYVSLKWRNTEIPGVFITIERQDERIAVNPDPSSPIRYYRRSFWLEVARLPSDTDPTNTSVERPGDFISDDPTRTPGKNYRVCSVVPVLGDAGKVCSGAVSLP